MCYDNEKQTVLKILHFQIKYAHTQISWELCLVLEKKFRAPLRLLPRNYFVNGLPRQFSCVTEKREYDNMTMGVHFIETFHSKSEKKIALHNWPDCCIPFFFFFFCNMNEPIYAFYFENLNFKWILSYN